jgi:hypothetical protein
MRGTRALLAGAAVVALFSGAARADSGNPASAFGPASDPPASGWQIGYYTPSPHGTLSYAQAKGGSQPTLNFTSEDNTALLITGQKAKFPTLLGDLSGDGSVTASFTISNAGVFTYFGEPSCEGPPPDLGPLPNVRFYFQTSNAGGFDETHYWWSNPVSQVLANGEWTLSDTFSPSSWSDYFGHFGADPMYTAGFEAALGNVTDIGVSFGGGCFFENGVGTTNGAGTFTLTNFSVS